ncbi:MAG: CRISPR-associated protein [Peptococcaceae bacterium]
MNSGEILFVKSVKDGIPNRDPLNDSDARRIFSEEDGRISLSDVSIKRDVRDYVLAKYEDGGADKDKFIFVREVKSPDGKLLGRKSLAEDIIAKIAADKKKETTEEVLKRAAFDVRTFGIVYSVTKDKFNLVGPVQFGWSHSLHPVMTKYIQGTVVMPSKDLSAGDSDGEGEATVTGNTQGTIWTSYTLPFAVFAMPAVINASIAKKTGMNQADQELLLEGLWKGTQNRQARGRGNQQPLLMVHVEYNDPFYRIGYLEDYIKLIADREDTQPTSVKDIKLDIKQLADICKKNANKIARCRYWINPMVVLEGEMWGEKTLF